MRRRMVLSGTTRSSKLVTGSVELLTTKSLASEQEASIYKIRQVRTLTVLAIFPRQNGITVLFTTVKNTSASPRLLKFWLRQKQSASLFHSTPRPIKKLSPSSWQTSLRRSWTTRRLSQRNCWLESKQPSSEDWPTQRTSSEEAWLSTWSPTASNKSTTDTCFG